MASITPAFSILRPLTSSFLRPSRRNFPSRSICTSSMSSSSSSSSVSPAEAHGLLSGQSPPLYIDVRMPQEYSQGHVPKAVNVPVTLGGGVIEPNFVDSVKEVVENAEVSGSLMIGCKSGKRSTMAIGILSENGFEDMIELEGGFDAWLANSDLPVEK